MQLQTDFIYTGFINFLKSKNISDEQRQNKVFIKDNISKFLSNFSSEYQDYEEALLIKFEQNNDLRTSRPISIVDNERNVEWFSRKNAHTKWINTELFKKYIIEKQIFSSNSEKIANDAFNTTREFIQSVMHPDEEGQWSVKGQVFGNVQMGKTTNYCMLINRAIDMGYKIIIVATGMHSDLRKQTQEEIDKFVIGMDTRDENRPFGVGEDDISIELLDPQTGDIKTYNKDPGSKIVTLTRNLADERGDGGDVTDRTTNEQIDKEKVTIIVTKKNTNILENTIKLFEQAGNSEINTLPLLFIDDEADQASINTNNESEEESEVPEDNEIYDNPTAINAKIRIILSKFDKHTYIGYSATPFANAFIDQEAGNFLNRYYQREVDEKTRRPVRDEEGRLVRRRVERRIQNVDDLFPRNFCHIMPVPSSYWGGREIFNVQANVSTDEEDEITHLPQVNSIEDMYGDDLDGLREDLNWCPSRIDPDFIPTYRGNQELPPSLKKAVLCFVLNVCIRSLRKMHGQHNTMLIHATHLTNVHTRICEQVQNYQNEILTALEGGDESIYNQFRDLLFEYQETQSKFNNIIENEYPKSWSKKVEYTTMPDWGKVKSNLINSMSCIQLAFTLNTSRESGSLDIYRNTNGVSIIVIGGNKLNRGVVLKGLSVSYFSRSASQKDTLLQMGRWFGYREGYKDLCRYFTEREIITNYRESIATTENYKERIISMNNRVPPGTPAQLGLMIRHSPHIRITRLGAMRNVEIVKENFSNQTITINKFLTNDDNDESNNKIVRDLFESKLIQYESFDDSSKRNICFKNVESKNIRDFLNSYKSPEIENQIWNSETIVDFINSQNRNGSLLQWYVVMTQLKHEKAETNDFNLKIKDDDISIFASERASQWTNNDNILSTPRSTWSSTKSDELAGLIENEVEDAKREYIKEITRDYEQQITKAELENSSSIEEIKKERDDEIDKVKKGKSMSTSIARNQKGTNGMLLFKWLAIKPDEGKKTYYKMGVSIHIPELSGDEENFVRSVRN